MIRAPTIRRWWILFGPLIFSPLLFFGVASRCVFCILLLSSFWIAEVVPIGVTSLLPLFLFPVLGIQSAKDVSQVYFKDSIVLFVCTLVMALAVEQTGLHKRIALKLLCTVGSGRQSMLFGFMCTTAFISFFVSDTACTALMVPIAVAILSTIQTVNKMNRKEKCEAAVDNRSCETPEQETPSESLDLKGMSTDERAFAKALVLACSHGSLIGGTAIITSTGPNLVFREMIQTFYPDDEITVTYLQWMTFAMPPMILYLMASYVVLTSVFLGPRQLIPCLSKTSSEEEHVTSIVQKNVRQTYEDLGGITFAELSVLGWFVVLISLWILRDPGIMPGWGLLFPDSGKMLTDSVPGVLVVFILFVWPRQIKSDEPSEPILNWNVMKQRFSWSCMLLIGAGYAISDGVQKSGLSLLISCTMKGIFERLQSIWLQLVATSSICFMTEFMSNVSTGSIFIPIVISIAEHLQIHPLYLALPTAVACSFAFMLPMATPPNAIVYDTRIVSMIDMISTGIFLNVLCILITVLNMNTWTYWLFDFAHVPEMPIRNNITMNC